MFQTFPRSKTGEEVVLRRNKATARLTANRHSFFGFESPSMIRDKEAKEQDSNGKMFLPDSQTLNLLNLSSTPRSKELHPLVEDEASPISVVKHANLLDAFTDTVKLDSDIDIKSTVVDSTIQADEEKVELNSHVDRILYESASDSPVVTKESAVEGWISPLPQLTETDVSPVLDPEYQNSCLAGLKIGDMVEVDLGKSAKVRFLGETKFADGLWAGLELNQAEGNFISCLGE